MNYEGLYRVNGNMVNIQRLRYDIELGHIERLEDVKNVNDLTGLIKLFFRELSGAIISKQHMNSMVQIHKQENIKLTEKRKLFLLVLLQMNIPTRFLLITLLYFL